MRKRLTDYPSITLNPDELHDLIDFAQVFGRRGPLHIEVGSGKGTFLVHQAQAQPEVDFLGIEWARRYYRHAVDRIGRRALSNVRMIRTDATTLLRNFVPHESVDCFHIYFPDPWPKKRQQRKRFLQSENLEMLIGRLKPGGQIRIATDHEGYFQQIQAVMSARCDKLDPIEFERPAGAREGELAGTNFERKYAKENRPTYTAAFRKKEG